ncbi:MAG: histidine kinase [Acutalibacteraceae bacterium]
MSGKKERKQRFRSLGRIFVRNLTLIVLITVLFTTITLVVIMVNSNRSIEAEIGVMEMESLGRINATLQSSFEQVQTVNAYFSTLVLNETGDAYSPDDIYWYNNLNGRVRMCITLLDYVQLIAVWNGEVQYSSDPGMEIPENCFQEENCLGMIKTTGIYTNAQEGNSNGLYFRLSANSGGYAENTVVVSVSAADLSKLILEEENAQRTAFIVDKNGRIVLSGRRDYLHQNFCELYGVNSTSLQKEESPIRLGGQSRLLTSRKLDGLELYAVSVTDTSFYDYYYRDANRRNLLIGLMLLVASAGVITIMFMRTYLPIRQILRYVSTFVPQENDKRFDEVVYINEKFRQLYSKNKELNTVVSEKFKQLQEYQVSALQAQINPHFIYNTLDAINWIAIGQLKRGNPISACVLNMGAVLQSSMDTSSLFHRLSEEVDISQKYVNILELRCDNRFDVVWEVDQTLLETVILKLCIQPILENAVQHGLLQLTERRGLIRIRIGREEGDLCIRVTDNGVGIEENQLHELIENIHSEKPQAKHIGMRNVNLRLKLIYGEKYGLTIQSRYGEGTTCTLLMPIDSF